MGETQELFTISENATPGEKFKLTDVFDKHMATSELTQSQIAEFKASLLKKWNDRFNSRYNMRVAPSQIMDDISRYVGNERSNAKRSLAAQSRAVALPEERVVKVAENTIPKEKSPSPGIAQEAMTKTTAGQNFIKAFNRSRLENI